MSWFQDFGAPWMDAQTADSARSGHALCIAWQPTVNGRPILFSNLVDGTHDELLSRFFRKAAVYPRSVTLRPFWEMNSSSSSSSVDHTGARAVTSVAQFREAWRHLVELQRRVAPGGNIKWYFNVNGTDVGAHRMEDYWPGARFVDEMGLNTYNDTWSPWADFDDKVRPMYRRLAALDPHIPLSVGEIGCREAGAPRGESKATWSRKMFTSTSFDRLRHVDFFNDGADWKIQTSWASLQVYKEFLPKTAGGLIATG